MNVGGEEAGGWSRLVSGSFALGEESRHAKWPLYGHAWWWHGCMALRRLQGICSLSGLSLPTLETHLLGGHWDMVHEFSVMIKPCFLECFLSMASLIPLELMLRLHKMTKKSLSSKAIGYISSQPPLYMAVYFSADYFSKICFPSGMFQTKHLTWVWVHCSYLTVKTLCIVFTQRASLQANKKFMCLLTFILPTSRGNHWPDQPFLLFSLYMPRVKWQNARSWWYFNFRYLSVKS